MEACFWFRVQNTKDNYERSLKQELQIWSHTAIFMFPVVKYKVILWKIQLQDKKSHCEI